MLRSYTRSIKPTSTRIIKETPQRMQCTWQQWDITRYNTIAEKCTWQRWDITRYNTIAEKCTWQQWDITRYNTIAEKCTWQQWYITRYNTIAEKCMWKKSVENITLTNLRMLVLLGIWKHRCRTANTAKMWHKCKGINYMYGVI